MIKICWICGDQANSSEHKIKRSDIIQSYGNKNYQNIPEHPVHYVDGVLNKVQGSNSKYIKYSNDLCSKCNNEMTQPFDKAYSIFSNYIYNNKELIWNKRMINFHHIYEDEFELQQKNLFKYFVKSFCCRLNDAGLPIPNDLKELLPFDFFVTRLQISFSVLEVMNKFPNDFTNGFFHLGNLYTTTSNGYLWKQVINYLVINFFYLANPEGEKGYPWIADNQFLYLGSIETFTQDEWDDIISVAKKLEEND